MSQTCARSWHTRRAAGRAAISLATALTAVAGVSPSAGSRAVSQITGHVRLVAPAEARPRPASYSSRTITTPGRPGLDLRNIVVYLNDAPETRPLPVMRRTIVQQDEMFVPHVTAITRGSWVEFPNADPFFHNVFSLSRAASFDLGRFPPGQLRARQFVRPGIVKVFCHLHAHMSALILVLDHPFFTTPADDGTFTIPEVPPGRYTVTAWHERIGEAKQSVHVDARAGASVEFALPVLEP
jgi:plastocyanin